MKQAKVKHLQGNGGYNSSHGYMYTHECTVEETDGTLITGEVASKGESPPYVIGDDIWYEIKTTHPQYGHKLKVTKTPPDQHGAPRPAAAHQPGGQDRIGNQWAIRDAVNMLHLQGNPIHFQTVAAVARELVKMRDNLGDYGLQNEPE